MAADSASTKNSTLDRIKQNPVVAVAMAVQKRFGELQGGDTASAITLSLFLSVFPLTLVAVTVLGLVASGNDHFVTDAINDMGLTGQAKDVFTNLVKSAQSNRGALTTVALLSGAWSGLGVSLALQKAANVPWQVSALGLMDRVKAIVFLLGGGALFAASFGLSGIIGWLHLPAWLSPINIVLQLALDTAMFTWLFWYLCSLKVTVRMVLPGALVAALGFGVLKWLATHWLPSVIAKSSAVYGSIGVIFGLFAWLLLLGKLLIYASTLNVVLAEREAGTLTLTIKTPQVAREWDATSTARGGMIEKPKKPLKLPWKKAPTA